MGRAMHAGRGLFYVSYTMITLAPNLAQNKLSLEKPERFTSMRKFALVVSYLELMLFYPHKASVNDFTSSSESLRIALSVS